MIHPIRIAAIALATLLTAHAAMACCPAPPRGKPVVNADQTVIMIWDPATKIQHFIRQASFKSEADDFGFIVPTPAKPELEESGNESFALLKKVTAPEVKKVPRPRTKSFEGRIPPTAAVKKDSVVVLEEKLVAGFNAVILEATSATALIDWLKAHDYAYSPEIEAWAKPYVEQGWKFTALKVAKGSKGKKDIAASALRITFKTDRPLFPYREPDPKTSAAALGTNHRLLRIYFIADARYDGELTRDTPWTGKVAWSGKMTAADRTKTLEGLKLPQNTGPADFWLTEFEDNWPYRAAPADVYFAKSATQDPVKREPIIVYVRASIPDDGAAYALGLMLFAPPIWRRIRK